MDSNVEKLLFDLIDEYGGDLDGVSVTDLYLAASLKRYKNLYLLTRNHLDFPERIFSRELLYNFELPKNVYTYSFYRYKSKKDVLMIEDTPF